MSACTKDAFLGGRVHVFQPEKGFRAGTDSVLLAAALQADLRGKALEVGCGSGGAFLPAMWRLPDTAFTGLEYDEAMADLARRGVDANGWSGRGTIVCGDASDLPRDWENHFDLVFSNPPFFAEGTSVQPGPGKELAYVESISLKDWVDAMLFALRPKGTLVMIHRAAELARILALIERRTGEITVLPVRSFPGAEAKRIIVRARKGLRSGPARLLAGLHLREEKGASSSALMARIASDGEGLDWT